MSYWWIKRMWWRAFGTIRIRWCSRRKESATWISISNFRASAARMAHRILILGLSQEAAAQNRSMLVAMGLNHHHADMPMEQTDTTRMASWWSPAQALTLISHQIPTKQWTCRFSSKPTILKPQSLLSRSNPRHCSATKMRESSPHPRSRSRLKSILRRPSSKTWICARCHRGGASGGRRCSSPGRSQTEGWTHQVSISTGAVRYTHHFRRGWRCRRTRQRRWRISELVEISLWYRRRRNQRQMAQMVVRVCVRKTRMKSVTSLTSRKQMQLKGWLGSSLIDISSASRSLASSRPWWPTQRTGTSTCRPQSAIQPCSQTARSNWSSSESSSCTASSPSLARHRHPSLSAKALCWPRSYCRILNENAFYLLAPKAITKCKHRSSFSQICKERAQRTATTSKTASFSNQAANQENMLTQGIRIWMDLTTRSALPSSTSWTLTKIVQLLPKPQNMICFKISKALLLSKVPRTTSWSSENNTKDQQLRRTKQRERTHWRIHSSTVSWKLRGAKMSKLIEIPDNRISSPTGMLRKTMAWWINSKPTGLCFSTSTLPDRISSA